MAENELTFEKVVRAKNAIVECYKSTKQLLCSFERFENLCENIALISMFDYVNDCAKSMYYYSDKIIEQTKNFINTKDFNDAEKILAFCYDKNLQIKEILKNLDEMKKNSQKKKIEAYMPAVFAIVSFLESEHDILPVLDIAIGKTSSKLGFEPFEELYTDKSFNDAVEAFKKKLQEKKEFIETYYDDIEEN